MQLLAQHGYGNGDKIESGLADGLLEGVIFGAKDISPEKLVSTLAQIADDYPQSVRLLDPQFYASLIAAQPGARLGYLDGENSHAYFEARRRRDLEHEGQVNEDIRNTLGYQRSLPVSAVIAPNIVIRRSFDSIEATISKSFLRNSAYYANELGIDIPLYATLAISVSALTDKIELQNFLQEITEMPDPPDGFYLLLEKLDNSIASALTEPDILSRWMLINHTLKMNGFSLINGYTDALSPYLATAGADAIASGWYNTQKSFSLKKFEPVSDFARRPVPRYMSAALLKSIRYTELNDLRENFPEVMNGLSCDHFYVPDEGSAPDSTTSETLQNWEGLNAMNDLAVEGDVVASLANCRNALDEAEDIYVRIQEYGLTMRDRSSAAHIRLIREELAEFEELAEL
jgi:hypothetical protein